MCEDTEGKPVSPQQWFYAKGYGHVFVCNVAGQLAMHTDRKGWIKIDSLEGLTEVSYLEVLEEKYYLRSFYGYAEPGYDEDKNAMLGDWNNVPDSDAKYIEELGFELEWEDEWLVCECGKGFRCSPNSYGWEMYGIIDDGSCVCGDCLKESPEEYLESLEDKPRRALTCALLNVIDPEDWGYELVNDQYENGWNGWHEGTDGDPEKILAAEKAKRPSHYLFAITGQGQFQIDFAIYRKIDVDEEDDDA